MSEIILFAVGLGVVAMVIMVVLFFKGKVKLKKQIQIKTLPKPLLV